MKEWLETFLEILIKPTPKTFKQEAKKGKKRVFGALAWLLITILIVIIRGAASWPEGVVIWDAIYFIGYHLLLSPFGFLIFVFFVYKISRVFNRKGDHYEEFLYILVSIYFLVVVGSILLEIIPSVQPYANVIVYSWGFVMLIAATKTIAKISTLQTLIVGVASSIIYVVASVIVPPIIFEVLVRISY